MTHHVAGVMVPRGRLNIKMPSYQYRDSHAKDKTISPTVLSLTWESPYLGKTVFILRWGSGIFLLLLWLNRNLQCKSKSPEIGVSKTEVFVILTAGNGGTYTMEPIPWPLHCTNVKTPGSRLDIKLSSYWYKNFPCGNKTVIGSFHLPKSEFVDWWDDIFIIDQAFVVFIMILWHGNTFITGPS